jgi:CubicO group peptidase (beta-lactamase class C family)
MFFPISMKCLGESSTFAAYRAHTQMHRKAAQINRPEPRMVQSMLIGKGAASRPVIVFERYSSGLTRENNYELYSITKAMTAMLAGKLIEEGKISLDRFCDT